MSASAQKHRGVLVRVAAYESIEMFFGTLVWRTWTPLLFCDAGKQKNMKILSEATQGARVLRPYLCSPHGVGPS